MFMSYLMKYLGLYPVPVPYGSVYTRSGSAALAFTLLMSFFLITCNLDALRVVLSWLRLSNALFKSSIGESIGNVKLASLLSIFSFLNLTTFLTLMERKNSA